MSVVWQREYRYGKGMLRLNCGCWFVFDRTGAYKIKVCATEKEARDFMDYWEMCYEY